MTYEGQVLFVASCCKRHRLCGCSRRRHFRPERQNRRGDLELRPYGTFSTPTVVNGTVYFGATEGVYALNADNGDKLWNYKSYNFEASPIVANGVVYIGSVAGNFYAFDATNGNELWNYTTSAPFFSAADITNGMAYVTPSDDSLHALNATNGNEIWNYSIPTTFIQISPIVVNNVVYSGSGNGVVYAFDATNRSKLWSYAVSNITLSSPAIVDGVLYIGSADGNVYALRVSPVTSSSVKSSTTLPFIIGVVLALIVATAILLMFQKRLKTKTKNPPNTLLEL